VSAVIADRWLLVQGGFDGTRCLSDAFLLDTKTSTWARLDCGVADVAAQPGPRALHAMCAVGHGLLLYGGAAEGTIFSNAFVLENAAVVEGARLAASLAQLSTERAALHGKLATVRADADCTRAVADASSEAVKVRCGLQPGRRGV